MRIAVTWSTTPPKPRKYGNLISFALPTTTEEKTVFCSISSWLSMMFYNFNGLVNKLEISLGQYLFFTESLLALDLQFCIS